MDEVNFRVSAYMTGDRANPRYVWGVGIPIELVESLPEDSRKVQLEADDDHFYVKFNGKGIGLNKPNPGSKMLWSGQIGIHHTNGLAPPQEVVRAKAVHGSWDPENKRLVVEQPPEFVSQAMKESSHHVPVLEEHFPATHFSEDVQHAVEENASQPLGFLKSDTTTDEIIEQAHIESDPDSPTYQWFLAQVKKGQESPFSEVVELTPELADILLRRNDGNRHIRKTKLNQYISDIANDRWQLNGETIQVSREGDLNNGQHRCSAVIASNKSIRTFMIFGVTRASRATVDVGAARTSADHLGVQGYKNSTILAGVARFVLAYEASGASRDVSFTNRITTAAINERVASDPELVKASQFTAGHAKSRRIAPPSVFGFAYYMFSRIDEEAAKTFMEQVTSGAGLQPGDAAYTVRETLINRPRLSRDCKIEVFFRGWNAFRQGKPMRSLRIMYELPALQ